MTTYSDLSIHQRINAKANALVYYGVKSNPLIARVCHRPSEFYTPNWPEYLMHYNLKDEHQHWITP